MSERLRISAKNLGDLAVPGHCRRCFWIKIHADKIPYQIFPGIFSSIDSYTKKVIHHFVDTQDRGPGWLAELGELRGYMPGPALHHSRYQWLDPETDVLLTGSPDDVFITTADRKIIVDYKTSRYTSSQRGMWPVYQVQLNGYALIGQSLGWEIDSLALVYFEPVTDEDSAGQAGNHRSDGFALGFSARIVPVELAIETILDLLKAAREIYDLARPPQQRPGCKDCEALDGLFGLVGVED